MPETPADEIIRIRTNSPTAPALRPAENSLWVSLREAREGGNLSVTDVADAAAVSVLTVEALESGAVERLPIGAAGRRELIAVCKVVHVDPEPYLDALRDRLNSQLSTNFERQRPPRRRSRFVIIGLIWVVLAGILLGSRLFGAFDDGADTGTGSPPASTRPTTTTTIVTSTTIATTTTTTAPPQPNAYRAVVAFKEPTAMTVNNGGEIVFDSFVPAGETHQFDGDKLILQFGDPSRVTLVVNGQERPAEKRMVFEGAPPG